MAAKTTLFTDAHHVNIQGSQFTTTQTTIIRSPALDPALQILHKNRALEASHTSKTAASAPKCKPGTRVKAINDLTTWADDLPVDPSPPVESVLWLRGPAGGGKTCILREVTRICHERRTLAGDYFFSTRVPGLDDEAPFVATIVSHLIKAIPSLNHPVLQTIESDPTIFEQSLEYQVEKLISNHITSIPPQSPAPRILVIDGFDECRDPKQRAHLLDLLHSLITPPHSFRVIMASRPELDIRTAFDQPPLNSMTKILHLENYETSGEIYQYLSDEFARIRKTHPAKHSIPSEWPGQLTLHALTDKSSGVWVYPTTVIKYVDNPRRHPVKLLEHVIDASSNASSGRPFAELDALYETILNPPDTDILLMKRLLHFIVEMTRILAPELIQSILSTSGLDEFLSLEKGTTEITLCDLHSILSVAGDSNRPSIYFHHKSLEDYLCSPERSGNLYQSQPDTCSDIFTTCIHNMQCWNRKLVSPNADFEEVDSTLKYLCTIWDILVFYYQVFPPSILDFDARIAWRCFAFASVVPEFIKEFYISIVDRFHNSMCKGKVECWRFCASFRRMLEYRPKLLKVIRDHSEAPPMERLKRFEEECQGLFDDPLDLSPVARLVTLPSLGRDADALSAPFPPPPEILSASGSGNVEGGHTAPPASTSELPVNGSKAPQTGSRLEQTDSADPPAFDDPIGTAGTTSSPQVSNPNTPIRDDASAGTPPPRMPSELGSGEVTGVHLTPEPIGTASYPQVPNPTTPVRDDASAGTPPPEKSSELGSEEVTGVHLTPEPIGTTSYPQVPNPTTPVRGNGSAGTPPPEMPSELGSGEVTGVHLTPGSPAAHSSVRLAPIFIWLVLPVFVASLDIYILGRTTSPPS